MPTHLPSDPLSALGPSIFLQVLSDAPFYTIQTAELVSHQWRSLIQFHEKSLWSSACHRIGVQEYWMITMEAQEPGGSCGDEGKEGESRVFEIC